MVKSSLRGPEIQPVPVPRAMSACIEYEGSKPMAVRPGPPKVCSSCWMTSLEPLAAQTLAAADLVSGGPGEVRGELGAQLDGVAVRVAVEAAGGLADPLGDALDQRLGQRVRVLVGVQPYGDVQLRRAVGGLAAQLVPYGQIVDADGHLRVRAPSSSNRALSAAPCAGRSSASASVTTWWVTSASASRV